MYRAKEHFFAVTGTTAAALFKASVTQVEIEISSYCNRKCSYCPNAFLDRTSNRAYMDEALYGSIIRQLGAIDYQGSISFHRYNEPLADRDNALRKISQCAALVPNAELQIYTNGDYLTADYVEDLYQAGCRKMICTAHINNGPNTAEVRHDTVLRTMSRIGLPHTEPRSNPNLCIGRVTYRDMDFIVRCQQFDDSQMFGRAGAVKSSESKVRTSPCFRPFGEMQIELDGTLLPCCELRSDMPSHADCILGRLTPDSNLFEAWSSATYAQFRRTMTSFDPKGNACDLCWVSQEADTPENRQMIQRFRSVFEGQDV